jgi:3-hydroxybutyryl-CoA dehydrogenase
MIIAPEKIKNFTIIGSGTLGSRIGLQAALSGYQVTLYDINEDSFNRAKKDFSRIKSLLVKYGRENDASFDKKTSHIIYTTDLEQACINADFISESVIEDISLKKKVWTEIGQLCPEHTIPTTNTSYLLPSYFATESGRPEMFCAFHFHDVFTARVVDIMPHKDTDPAIISLLKEVGYKLNQIPVVIQKETPGYIFNKLFGVILTTAGSMLAQGIADVEDIDKSWMGNFNVRIGPFGMMDEVGLDTVYHVAKNMDFTGKEPFMHLIKKMLADGKLGIKSGSGFYSYPNPSFKNKNFLITT